MHQSHKKPKKTIGDVVHTITKAGLSSIPPPIGSPIAELFNAIILPPIEKRRNEWIQGIAVHLEELELKVEGLKIENLSKNESFITTMMHASYAAIRSHQKEKLEALKNAVLNSALPNAPEDDLQIIFLNLIDRYSPSHIRMLNVYYEAEIEYRSKRKPDLVYIVRRKLTDIFPDIMERLEFYYQFFGALVVDNLVNSSYSEPQLQANLQKFSGEISPIGIQFIEFITSPLSI